MKKASMRLAILVLAALPIVNSAQSSLAGDWTWLNISHFFKGTPKDIHGPQCPDQCGHEGCIERTAVKECVPGKKRNDKVQIRYEYLAIPEVRYHWRIKRITKEIPCKGVNTVCEEKKVEVPYTVEAWKKQQNGCDELHCKTCVRQTEMLPRQECKSEPGETTIKVRYWSCVKVPYTVYRQVRKEVCVKQPCYEHVEVPVTRYVCKNCGGLGCKHCAH